MARVPRVPRLAALLVIGPALGACRTSEIDRSLLSEEAVTLDLPIVRQDELYECGLAAISALCQYWSVEIPAHRKTVLAQRAREAEGLSGNELREALESVGLETFLFRGSLDRSETGIYRHVDAGRPLLVMLGAGESGHHYSLVLGYDEPRHNIALLDPARGEVLRPVETFASAWDRCERFTLLACPKAESTALPPNPRQAYPGRDPPGRSER